MNTNEANREKVEKPHANFETPHEVIVDSALSKEEKVEALDTLEQDARLLATASAEGMAGGEPSNLHEVLDAKGSLESAPIDHAYDVVLRDLRSRQAAGRQDGMQALIKHAIEALEALERAQASTASNNPPLSSDEEVAQEAEIEKLDP
jgi:hypothetical protein